MAPKKKKAASGEGQVSKRAGKYNATLKKATLKANMISAAAAAVESEVTWAQEREKLLVDFIKCQEEIETILQQQEALLAELESAPDPAAAIQANLARSVAAQVPPCSSWATYMFAQATVGHIMFVRGMTMQDWCQQGCQSFVQLSALLELCNRDLQPQPEGFGGGAALGGGNSDAGAGNNNNSCSGGGGQQQQQAGTATGTTTATATPSTSAGGTPAPRSSGGAAGVLAEAANASPEAAAVGSGGGGAVSAAAVLARSAGAVQSAAFPPADLAAATDTATINGSTPPAAEEVHGSNSSQSGAGCAAAASAAAASVSPIAQLYSGPDQALLQFAEQSIMAVLVAMFHNRQPYYAAAACNLSTGQVELMPQDHIRQVVQRLQLSARQVMHLRIINTEFVRLGRVTSQEGESLAEHLAKLSLSAVSESYDQQDAGGGNDADINQQAAGAEGGTDSGAAGSDQGGGAGSSRPVTGRRNSSTRSVNNAAARAVQLANAMNAVAGAAAGGVDGSHAAADAAAAGASGSGTASAGGSADELLASVAAAAAAAGDGDGLDVGAGETPGEMLQRQLERYLRTMHIHTVVTAMCVVNTLTPRQMATLSVAEACMDYSPPSERHRQQQQQQQLLLQQRLQQQMSGDLDAAQADAGAAAGASQQQQQQQPEVVVQDAWARQVEAHMALRNSVLEQQVMQWWRNNQGLVGNL